MPTEPAQTPVNPVSVVNQITNQIRHWIVSGSLPPGNFSITQLANQLGVSHIPVREAIRRLETEGLMAMRPARGGEVTAMNKDDVEGICGLRLLIDPSLAARGAVLLDDDDFRSIRTLVRQSRTLNIGEKLRSNRLAYQAIIGKGLTAWDLRNLYTAFERYTWLQLASEAGSKLETDYHQAQEDYIDVVATRTAKPRSWRYSSSETRWPSSGTGSVVTAVRDPA